MRSGNFEAQEFLRGLWLHRSSLDLPITKFRRFSRHAQKRARNLPGTPLFVPWAVAPLFEHWLEEHFPDRKEKVLGRIRHLRGNRLNNSQWHTRMTVEGIFAEHIAAMFAVSCRRNRMCARPKLSSASFQRPTTQPDLFS